MPIAQFAASSRRGAAMLAMVMLAPLAAGCSTDRFFGSEQSSASAEKPSVTAQVKDLLLPKQQLPTPAERQAAVATRAESHCPDVDVRIGASTLTVPPGSPDAFSLRYQGSIGELARECSVSGGVMRIKVGIEGRVLVGPAGGPGQLDVPLRYAVVKEGPEPKTVVSKFSRVPVTIPEGQPNVLFRHVDADIAFPMPPGLEIESYVVYVGFDPLGDKQQPAKKPPAKKPASPARR